MEDDKDWARKVTAANALASPTLHLWQTASSTVPCTGLGSWALPELQGGKADMILEMQQNQEISRGQALEDDMEFIHLLKKAIPAESLGSNLCNPRASNLRALFYHISFPLLHVARLGKKGLYSSSWEKLQAAHITKRPWESHEKVFRYLCRKQLPKETHEKAGLTLSSLLENCHWLSSVKQMFLVLWLAEGTFSFITQITWLKPPCDN